MSRVLAVDDDPDILLLVQLRLRAAGYEVYAARDAADALAIVNALGMPHVAVLDVELPGRNGFELLRELHSRPGGWRLPAVFLTARVQPADLEIGRALGAIYLTKPFVAAALVTAVHRALLTGG